MSCGSPCVHFKRRLLPEVRCSSCPVQETWNPHIADSQWDTVLHQENLFLSVLSILWTWQKLTNVCSFPCTSRGMILLLLLCKHQKHAALPLVFPVHLEYFFTNWFYCLCGKGKKKNLPTNTVVASTESVLSPEKQSVLTRTCWKKSWLYIN